MVRVSKRVIRGKSYYYLEHTLRIHGGRKTKSKYLGTIIPKNFDLIKKKFVFELEKEKWFASLEKIRQRYQTELRRMPKSAIEKQNREFSVRFTYNTQRIEGSTLTLRETAQLLEDGISPREKPIQDVKEAEANQKVFLEILQSRRDLSQQLIQDWHWRIFSETKADIAGKIRKHGIRITGSEFIPPSPVDIQPLLNEFFSWYEANKKRLNPVELAARVHLRFVTIHPFADGNGRISRLMMNLVLFRHGFPMFDIEYKGRTSYYGSLERSHLRGEERPFLNWFFRKYLREHVRLMNG